MALRPPGARWAVTNDEAGIAALVTRLEALAPPLLVREATGGSQRAVVAGLAAVGLPVVVVHPRHARDVATAPGPWARTEILEARALAHVADAVRPAPRPLSDAHPEAWRALLARRRPRITMRTTEQHRLGSAPRRLQAAMQAPMSWLHARVAARDDDRDTTRRASPVWREREAWLRRVPGLGPVCARPLGLALPEWGTLSRQPRAAVVGVAPVPRDRGTRRGRRTLWGGRAHVRAPRYLRTLVAVRYHPGLNACYERLRTAGKAAQVARTACLRQLLAMLHAMVKHHTPWQAQEVSIAEHTRRPLTTKTVAPLCW